MSTWNYVATAHKPTTVTHSCVGKFTGPEELNLVIAKCTRVEIHLYAHQGLQLMWDGQKKIMRERICTLDLFRPHGETKDLLYIITERYKFCILEWDRGTQGLITRMTMDVATPHACGPTNAQIMFEPEHRMIGLRIYGERFRFITYDDRGQLMQNFDIRLGFGNILDTKFLYGCKEPTIIVLYEQYAGAVPPSSFRKHLQVYSIIDKRFVLVSPFHITNIDKGADLLIPLPDSGFLIIGGETIVHKSFTLCHEIRIEPVVSPPVLYEYDPCLSYPMKLTRRPYRRVYARIHESCYLLGDDNGMLHLLKICSENLQTADEVNLLGQTSIASSISYLDDGVVFVGSSYEDSQLIKLNLEPEFNGSRLEVLESYVNLGPMVDFCMCPIKLGGMQVQSQVVTCSKGYKHGCLCVLRNGTRVNVLGSLELQAIDGMWSLKSAIDDLYHTFLVVSSGGKTGIWKMRSEDELAITDIQGFCSDLRTLYCHHAVYDQFVQVTPDSIRLVKSTTGELCQDYTVNSVTIATANPSQVLLAAVAKEKKQLIYLEIGDGELTEVMCIELANEISCLDISPIGNVPNRSELAAVGLWMDNSVSIFSLPDLELLVVEHLEVLPRSVLLCSFEGISYLLCAIGDGRLLSFVLKLNPGGNELMDRKEVLLGSPPVNLRTFSLKNATHVFAASDTPSIIYSSNSELLYSNINLEEVTDMCAFNSAGLPQGLAIAGEGKLTVATIDQNQKLNHIRTIPLGKHARCICHHEQTGTFAICSSNYEQELHYVQLFDDQKFNCISSYLLGQFERGCSIITLCHKTTVLCCVGTAYVMPKPNDFWALVHQERETESTKGRILVFAVEDRELVLISKMEMEEAVYSVHAFNGKLLAVIGPEIRLFDLKLRDDGSHELQFVCGHRRSLQTGHLTLQTMGNYIFASFAPGLTSLLVYKDSEGSIKELASERQAKNDVNWMPALEFWGNDIYLGAEEYFNLYAFHRKDEGRSDEESGRLEVVGEYYLGEFVNRFRHGLVKRLPDPDVGQYPTVVFGTVSGVLGVIASLPRERYLCLEKLQIILKELIKSMGEPSHEERAHYRNEKKKADAINFLDGDLIESFLDLSSDTRQMISMKVDVPPAMLMKIVQELTRLL